MRIIISALSFVLLSIGLFSCQREVDGTLPGLTESDTTVQPMMRIVQRDERTGDSLIQDFKTIYVGGQKSVLMTETYPGFPDSLFCRFSYNTQNRLTGVIVTYSLQQPIVEEVKYVITWEADRVKKVTCDTSGRFSESYDFAYTPAGINTNVKVVRTPYWLYINDPTSTLTETNSAVLNSSFIPVSSFQASHRTFNSLNQRWGDTATATFTMGAQGITKAVYVYNHHDTTISSPAIEHSLDTTTYDYVRSSMGSNLTDSLKKIFSNELYTLQGIHMFDFDNLPSVLSLLDYERYLYFNPFTSSHHTKRRYVNGVFTTNGSYPSTFYRKIENRFDGMGRLIEIDSYEPINTTVIETKYKIYYY